MSTRKVTLTGPVRWAKVFKDNRDMSGYEDAYREHGGGYTIEIGLTDDEFQKLKDAGSMKKGKEGDDGLTWVKLLRKHEDRFEWASGAPTVTDATGDPWDFEDQGMIGNDSEAEISVSVYDTSRPRIKGTRLDSVKVLRNVPVEEKVPF